MRKEFSTKVMRQGSDMEFEIAFFENILKERPQFIEALAAIGDLYTRAGMWQKGLEVDLKLAGLKPGDPLVFYNLACSYALLGQTRPSLSSLIKAIEFGYDDFEHLRHDGDLESLMKDAYVQAYIKKVEKKNKLAK